MAEDATDGWGEDFDEEGNVIGDVPGENVTAPFESQWHLAPAGALTLSAVAMGLLLGAPDTPLSILGLLIGMGGGMFALVSLGTYYVEASRLKDANAPWVPAWWLYAIGHILLSPFVVAPVYLLQRWRHIGLGSTPKH